MARQLGHVNYGGTIGGIRHFKIKGLSGNFAGLKGGASGDQIKNDSAFVRTRENMNEFGGCAIAGKSLRTGLAQIMKQMSDPQLAGRLTGIMKKINLEDQSEARGYRAILVSLQPQYLLGLNFNRNNSFEGLFTGTVETATTAERNSVTLNVEPFNSLNNVNAPAGATHFRLVNAITVLSDFAYNATTKIYEPIEPTLNETSKITYSDYIELGSSVAAPLSVESVLPGTPTMTADVSLISCVGIEFYQKVGANYYIFSVGNSLKIKNIF
jgi:hypothetical protein